MQLRFAVTLLELSCREKILFSDYPAPRDVAVDDERLVDELWRAIYGYLRTEEAE